MTISASYTIPWDTICRRGFRVIENAGHFVIICNNEPVRILT